MDLVLIQNKIVEVRGRKVMLDFDLAGLFGVETKRLKEQVKRNRERFPEDFMIELTRKEWTALRPQFATSSWGGARYLPFAFSEHGVTMLASVLRSERAVQMNIAIVRAFIAMRAMAMHYEDLADKIAAMEQKCDLQFGDIYEALRYLTSEKEAEKDWASRERIGFKKDSQ